jgi:predicted membrane GTPase involved in stress response
LNDEKKNIFPLLDFIIEKIPEATNDETRAFRMQVANLGYDNFL